MAGRWVGGLASHLAVNILPHADGFSIFVKQFSVLNKPIFLVKSQNTLIMLQKAAKMAGRKKLSSFL